MASGRGRTPKTTRSQKLRDNEASWTTRSSRRRRSYADAAVDETSAEAGGLEVGVLLRAGHLDAPHLLPGVVQLHVHRVDARVVGGHGVAHVGGNPVFLVVERGREKKQTSGGFYKLFCLVGKWQPLWWKHVTARNVQKK